MITMEMYDHIRFLHINEGKSVSEIHKETNKSKPTIRKYLREAKPPKYNLKKEKNKPVMGKYLGIIREWLEKDKEAPVKQRHTAKRIYDRLVENYGFTGGMRTVSMAVKELKEELVLKNAPGFIPSDPKKRRGFEVDWGDVYVDIKDSRTLVYMFCMRSKYSGKTFIKLYPTMIQECFFDGHIEAFSYFSAVPEEIVYDNLKTAVQKVLKGRNRLEQESFVKFRSHYSYKAVFCNVGSGNENE